MRMHAGEGTSMSFLVLLVGWMSLGAGGTGLSRVEMMAGGPTVLVTSALSTEGLGLTLALLQKPPEVIEPLKIVAAVPSGGCAVAQRECDQLRHAGAVLREVPASSPEPAVFSGVDYVFLLPPLTDDRAAVAKAAINAIDQVRPVRPAILLLSVIGAQSSRLPSITAYSDIEAWLSTPGRIDQGRDVVLRTEFYTENLMLWAADAKKTCRLRLPLLPNSCIAPLYQSDVAIAVQTLVMGTTMPPRKTYTAPRTLNVRGPSFLSGEQLALAAATAPRGTPLTFESITNATATTIIKHAGTLDQSEATLVVDLITAQSVPCGTSIPNDFPSLTSRNATPVETFFSEVQPAFANVTCSSRSDTLLEPPPFGAPARDEFMMAEGFLNFNHGSFGATPRVVIEAQQKLVARAESRPDDWFRQDYRSLLSELRPRVARLIDAASEDVAFVENASSAMNALLRTLLWAPTDAILVLDTAYGMVKNTLAWLTDKYDVKLIYVEIPLPLADDREIDTAVEAALKANEGTRIRMATFSHISSVPALILPVVRLAQLCKKYGVERVIVDGAHALGNIPVSMRKLAAAGVDGWCGNGHKWLYSPKGSALLWLADSAQPAVVPTVVSSEWRPSDFRGQFIYTGTRDYTPYIAIDAALDFREKYGAEAVEEYMADLSRNASEHLSKVWGSEVIAPSSMTNMAMTNIQVPTTDSQKASTLADRLYKEFDMYCVVYSWAGKWWFRLSAQIYLEMRDFERLGEAVLQILKE